MGSVVDALFKTEYKDNGKKQGDFVVSLLVCFAKVMRSDGRVLRSELNFVKRWLTENLDPKDAQNRLQMLKALLEKEVDLKSACIVINNSLTYEVRLELVHMLFAIGLCDGELSEQEKLCIENISRLLKISSQDYTTICNMYFKDTDSAYKILQVESTASNEEIKKAYRKLCVKYHPDKVASLGEKIQKDAEQKFKKINEAYETIKKERNFN